MADLSTHRLGELASWKFHEEQPITVTEIVSLIAECTRRRLAHEAVQTLVPAFEQYLRAERHHQSNPRLCDAMDALLAALRIAAG